MKKILSKTISCIILLAILFSFAGCTTEKVNQKTEEEIRAEVKKELEEQIRAEIKKEMEEEVRIAKEKKDNIYDLVAIYEFVKDKVEYKDFNDFKNSVEVTMSDITGEGTEEAILAFNWTKPIIFVSVDNGNFKIIPTDLTAGWYTTKVTHMDNFILMEGTGGGTGLHSTYIEIAYYTGTEIKTITKEGITTEYSVAAPSFIANGEGHLNINGESYEKFDYLYNEYQNDEHVQQIIQEYKFDETTMSYNVITHENSFDKTIEGN